MTAPDNKPIIQPSQFSVGGGGAGGSKKRLVVAGIVVLVLITAAVTATMLWHNDNKNYSAKKSTGTAGSELPSGQVNVTDKGFTPSTLKIKVGQSVTWVNLSGQAHRITEDPYTAATAPHGLDSQEPIANGESYTYTFDEAGTYTYHDHLNPTDNTFHGTIEVTQ
jgi:plastocyanin